MTSVAWSLLIGYLLGSFSPSAAISIFKKTDLRSFGSGNLGATNVTLTLGKWYGVFVMAVDMLKGYLSVKIARMLFPHLAIAGLLGGCSAVVGHIYPLYLKFKGGKGLAAFGGMILALDPAVFLPLAVIGIIFAVVSNYAVFFSLSAVTLAPFAVGLHTLSFSSFGLLLLTGGLIIHRHSDNVVRIKNGSEPKLREYLRERKEKNTE